MGRGCLSGGDLGVHLGEQRPGFVRHSQPVTQHYDDGTNIRQRIGPRHIQHRHAQTLQVLVQARIGPGIHHHQIGLQRRHCLSRRMDGGNPHGHISDSGDHRVAVHRLIGQGRNGRARQQAVNIFVCTQKGGDDAVGGCRRDWNKKTSCSADQDCKAPMKYAPLVVGHKVPTSLLT